MGRLASLGVTRQRLIPALVALLVVGVVAATAWIAFAPGPVEPRVVAAPVPTTAPPVVDDTYVVATATVPVLEVLADPPDGLVSSPLLVVRPAPTRPIPREGFDTAGVAVTDDGFAYDNPTYFGNPMRLLVVAEHDEWLEVALPARPNQMSGWVRRDDVDLETHDARMELDLATRRLVARVDGEVVVDAITTIGTEGNPTPTGVYFVTEVIPQNDSGGPFGPFILATSAYSERLELFEDGMPVVAVHGTNEPDLMGEAATNGCVRLTNDLITQLANELPPGVPLIITDSGPRQL